MHLQTINSNSFLMYQDDKNRSSLADSLAKVSKYTGIEVMPMRQSLGKFKPSGGLVDHDKNMSGKLFYLKKNRNDLVGSYNSTQFSNYLSSQKENLEDNTTSSLKQYLNLKKDKLIAHSKKQTCVIETKKPSTGYVNKKTDDLKDNDQSLASKRDQSDMDQTSMSRLTSQRLKTAPNFTIQQNLLSARPVLQELSQNKQQ